MKVVESSAQLFSFVYKKTKENTGLQKTYCCKLQDILLDIYPDVVFLEEDRYWHVIL